MADPISFGDVLLDIEAILRVFADHDVAFVLVGGVAAQLNGSPLTTEDVDLTPDRDAANLQRCAEALNALGAQWRVPGLTQGFPSPARLSGADISQKESATFVTRSGFVAIVLRHSDGASYTELVDEAEAVTVYGLPIAVASVDAIICAKEAAGRDEDARALSFLYDLQGRGSEHGKGGVQRVFPRGEVRNACRDE